MQQVGSDQDGIGGGYADHYRRMLQREREEENKTLFRRMKK
jgi:adenylosuccinate synthase